MMLHKSRFGKGLILEGDRQIQQARLQVNSYSCV